MRELAKEEPIDSLDDLLDIPNILRMASEKGADVSNPDSHIQLRIVFYDGNTETYPTTLSYNLVKQAIKDLFSRESSKREAEIRIDELKKAVKHGVTVHAGMTGFRYYLDDRIRSLESTKLREG